MKKKKFVLPEIDFVNILGDDVFFSTDNDDYGFETGDDGEIIY